MWFLVDIADVFDGPFNLGSLVEVAAAVPHVVGDSLDLEARNSQSV